MNDIPKSERRFVYFYLNRNDPERTKQVVPAHMRFWKTANLNGYMGSPFGDRTGGLISFAASSLEEATEVILQDPFIVENLISEKWIKEWVPE